MESTSIRGLAASSRASASTPRPVDAVISPRLVTTSAATTNSFAASFVAKDVDIAFGRSGGGGFRAPALVVGGPDDLRVRNGADDRADVDLLVRIDGQLARAAVRLAPDDVHLGADLDAGSIVASDSALRSFALKPENIEYPTTLPLGVEHGVVAGGPVVGDRDVEELVALAVRARSPSRGSP